MIKKKRNLIILSVISALVLSFIIWIVWSNFSLQLSTYTVSSDNLPKAFDGYRIAHVSDLHNAEFGSGNEKLLRLLRESSPDVIVITGDIIDSSRTDVDVALDFVKEAVKIAPCYYVTGNHEAGVSKEVFEKLESTFTELGVKIMRGSEAVIEKGGEYISLIGIDDPSFAEFPENIDEISTFDGFKILLSHRPEYFDKYADWNVDLVLSGHAHGGQFRLPFIGGLVAPGQGLFPKYDAGSFTEDNTTMIVSRGIGNSIIPVRFNNQPELVLVVLESK